MPINTPLNIYMEKVLTIKSGSFSLAVDCFVRSGER